MNDRRAVGDTLDLPADVAAWIGRRLERADTIAPRLVASFEATLMPHLVARSAEAPLGLFWCLAPDLMEPQHIGADGHPQGGLLLPRLPYPRRMWAGGDLAFHGAFKAGDVVTKTSTIADIVMKTGRSGRLAFVTMRHAYGVGGHLVLAERQDVVYREAAGTGTQPTRPPALTGDPPLRIWTVAVDPVMLFRYSALTFNGHRIHYDRPYATAVEGYDGLVIHGALQATLMLNLAADLLGSTPTRFAYRGHAPAICDGAIQVQATRRADAALMLRVLSGSGTVTMTGEAH